MVEKAKTLILGAKGMLGRDLCTVFPDAIKWDYDELDITDKNLVFKKITSLKPSLVINAAAYTNVDGAESDKETAFRVNADAVGYIAEACNKINADLVHFSTDYVFDGKKKGYTEFDFKNPLNVYGASKAKGEELLMQHTKRYYLVRTCWLFGKHGKNFVDTIIRLARERDKLTIVKDQIGSPTFTKDLAEKVKELIGKPYGIYNITNDGVCSWFGFASEIVKLKNLKVKILPMRSSQLKRPARRPKYSILLKTKLPAMRNWKDALHEYLSSSRIKGVILAGGMGTRLGMLTRVTNKHLLPVWKKPMILYPLQTLMDAGIREIMIVSGPEHSGHFLRLLGSGKEFGVKLTYEIQDGAGGIAHALSLAKDFADKDNLAVILGDNIYEDKFYFDDFKGGARIFLKPIPDANRFGVAEVKRDKIINIEEKPKKPKTNLAVTGMYLYDSKVFDIIRNLKPSSRGELEITDVNNEYIKKGEMQFSIVRGFWSDAGTFDSLLRASTLVKEKEEKANSQS